MTNDGTIKTFCNGINGRRTTRLGINGIELTVPRQECANWWYQVENAIESGELIARDSAEIAGWKVGDLIKAAETLVKTHGSGELAEVVRGKWNSMRDNPECDTIFVCSNCGETWILNDGTPKENNMNYCPKCGAKMDLEGEK